jgi:serine/threonine protein kinase
MCIAAGLGNRSILAPEVLLLESRDVASDVWSLGVSVSNQNYEPK